jgi:DamX protein
MSKSISQLAEQERAKLLEAIEAQANRISSKRDPHQTDISLSDWLNAVEKVIPETKEPAVKASGNPATNAYQENAQDAQLFANKSEPSWDELFAQEPRLPAQPELTTASLNTQIPSSRGKVRRYPKKNPAKAGPYFGVVVMLSLLLAMTGILYLAYMQVTEEFKRLETLVLDQEAQISQLETLVIDTQMLLEQHEDAPIVISLMQRVTELEAAQTAVDRSSNSASQELPEQIEALAAAQSTLEQQFKQVIMQQAQNPSSEMISQLEQRILQRLQPSSELPNIRPLPMTEPEHVYKSSSSQPTITPPIAPSNPTEPSIINPVIHPNVAVVEDVSEVSEQTGKSARIRDDIAWLEQQTGQHYVIQLAAMEQPERLEQIIRQHNFSDVRILPQVRNDQTRYILVNGSYSQRSNAVEQANRFREQTGITPWIRRVNDINGSLR